MAVLEYEGLWEELVQREPEFRGRRVRLSVLPLISPSSTRSATERQERAEEFLRWAFSHTPSAGGPLPDSAIQRDSIYADDRHEY